MDKIYSEFASYTGEASGFEYCNDDAVVAAGALPSAPAAVEVEVPMLLIQHPQYQLQYKLPSYTRPHQAYLVKQEHDDKQQSQPLQPPALQPPSVQPPSVQPLPLQPQQTCVETQTHDTDMAPTAYFVDVTQQITKTFGLEEKKQVRSQQAVVQSAVATAALEVKKKKYTRSKVANPKTWSSNVRKEKHQKGEEYVSRRGKLVAPKTIRDIRDCSSACKLHCARRLSSTDRQLIFKAFYSLTANEKKHFLLNTTERHQVKRVSKLNQNNAPKRQYSFKYFFLVRAERYNVCKAFYLGTLAISQKPVYNVHAFKSDMNLPKPDGRGLTPTSVHAIPEERKERVRRHISSFPIVDTTKKKKYLAGDLSVKKMYDMYVAECERDGESPLKENMYRKIFNGDFNLHFNKAKVKVERCENCKHPLKRKHNT